MHSEYGRAFGVDLIANHRGRADDFIRHFVVVLGLEVLLSLD